MLYVWIENQTLCGTSLPECAPKNAILYENYNITDLEKFYIDNGVIKIKSEYQLLEEKKDRAIKLLRNLYYERLSKYINSIIDFLLTKTLNEADKEAEYFNNVLAPDIDKVVKIRKDYVDAIEKIKKINNISELNQFCETMGCNLD